MTSLCALLTCFNRRDKTLACLEALFACHLPDGVELHVVLMDDGSTDGTSEAVHVRFPQVELLRGNGSLYWNGGMRCAFGVAMASGRFTDYLWLNDDTTLDRNALHTLYAARLRIVALGHEDPVIVAGATRDPDTGVLTYGGLVARDVKSPNYFVNQKVGHDVQRCRTINGNCVLIPDSIARTLGNLDESFVHAIGDWDYGLRAAKAGFGVWVAPGYIGTCARNPPVALPPEVARSVGKRLKFAAADKRLPPRPWLVYVRRHYGALWPLEFVRPYASAILRALWAKLRPAEAATAKSTGR